MDIPASKILPISNIQEYKIHLAVWNGAVQPLNHELKKLISDKGFQHARDNFYFSILEILVGEDDQTIIDREQHWKRVLQTMSFGNYNKN